MFTIKNTLSLDIVKISLKGNKFCNVNSWEQLGAAHTILQ